MTNKKRIIVDCDPGIDDALALTLLIKSQLFHIEAITTIAGNCTINNATSNAQYILSLLESNIPIYAGASKPLKKKLITAKSHGKDGLAGVVIPKNSNLTNNAVSKIAQILTENPLKITLVAIGPLTNIARLLINYPKESNLIKEIVIMGGAFNTPGNQTKFAEFNFFVDPDAASIVFKSKIKKTIIPLDVCNKVKFNLKDLYFIKKFKLPIYLLINEYAKRLKKFSGIKKVIIYDAVAAYYLINSKAFITKISAIDIAKDSLKRGKTTMIGQKNKFTQIAFDINVLQFKKYFINILNQ